MKTTPTLIGRSLLRGSVLAAGGCALHLFVLVLSGWVLGASARQVPPVLSSPEFYIGCVLIFVLFTVWSFVDESGKRSTTHGMTCNKSSENQIEEGSHS